MIDRKLKEKNYQHEMKYMYIKKVMLKYINIKIKKYN